MYVHPANIYVPLPGKKWFITNPVAKTADILGDDVVKFLKKSVTPKDTQELAARGYLTETPVALSDVYKNVVPAGSPGMIIAVGLTYACNFQCVYCFQRAAPQSHPQKTLTADKVSLLSQAVTMLKKRLLVVSPSDVNWEITGGEPLLPGNRSVLESLLGITGKNKLLITTNGYYLSEFVDILSMYPVKVKITLDGTPPVHDSRKKTVDGQGTYSNIVKGIQNARDAGIKVAIKVNVDPGNVENLCSLVDLFQSYGWTKDDNIILGLARVRKNVLYPSGWTQAEYVEYMCAYLERHNLQEYFGIRFSGHHYFDDIVLGKKPETDIYRCRADRMFFFSPDGLIYPCIRMDNYVTGTFYPQVSFNDAQINQLRARSIKTLSKCLKCRYALLCGGGCPAESMNQHGTIDYPVCIDYPRILKAYIPYLLKKDI